jgi:hypothetical protein
MKMTPELQHMMEDLINRTKDAILEVAVEAVNISQTKEEAVELLQHLIRKDIEVITIPKGRMH